MSAFDTPSAIIQRHHVVAEHLLRARRCRPEEVADAVAFLVSPRASYITGANLRIDGAAVKSVNF